MSWTNDTINYRCYTEYCLQKVGLDFMSCGLGRVKYDLALADYYSRYAMCFPLVSNISLQVSRALRYGWGISRAYIEAGKGNIGP
eukprot:Awhi_evm1s2728